MSTEEKDTAYYIFEKRWVIRTRKIDVTSIEDIRRFGTPTSGDPTFDEYMKNEIVERYMTIAQMVEVAKNAGMIQVVKKQDSAEIYQRIQNHLLAWEDYVRRSYDLTKVPYDDLIELDKFAAIVYDKAKYVLGKRFENNSFLDMLRSRTTVDFNGTHGEKDEGEYVERDSMANIFRRTKTLGWKGIGSN